MSFLFCYDDADFLLIFLYILCSIFSSDGVGWIGNGDVPSAATVFLWG